MSQVRSLLEYASLSWQMCPLSRFHLLDEAEEQARRLIAELGAGQWQESPQQMPQHRSHLVEITVLYKANMA